jgi:polysaccharide pyruvyl transferase WcaK-like protein
MKKKNKTIAIHASYFGDNFGDSLFIIEYVNYLKEIGYLDSQILLPFAGKRIRSYVTVSEVKGFEALLRCDSMAFVGGGYFGERPTQKIVWHIRLWVRHLLIGLFCILFNKKYAFFGVGAGPLNNFITRFFVKKIINASSFFAARDDISLSFLESIGVHKNKLISTSDALISYPKKKYSTNKSLTKNILIHIPVLKNKKKQVNEILTYLKNEIKYDYKIFISSDFYKPSFKNISEVVANELFENVEIVPYESPEKLIKLLSYCDLIITNKLHVGILSITQGKFVISAYHHLKTPRFYDQINHGELCFPFDNFNSENKMIFKKALNSFSTGKIIAFNDDILSKSRKNYDLFKTFVSKV